MAHVHIIGQSGSGKSTLMKELMVEDMKNGHAVLFIDPHGPDTDDLLHYVPRGRIEDTVLFDPTEPIQWNPLQESDNLPLVAQLFFDSAHAAWRMGIGTPTMEMMLQSLVYTALLTDRTVFEAFNLIRHPDELESIGHPLLKDFWSWYEKKTDKDRDLISGSTYNKLYTLFLDDRMRQLFDTRSGKFRFSDMMDHRVTFVRLPQGQLGLSKVSLIGSLILSQMQLLAQNRDTTVPLSVYIDECHLFSPTVLAEMLTGIRKYNVRLTLAHQTIEQVGDLFGTISGNCSTRYAFRISSEDAKRLAQQMRTTSNFILEQPKGTFAAQFRDIGTMSFPVEIGKLSRVPKFREISDVREDMRAKFPPLKTTPPPKNEPEDISDVPESGEWK